MLRPASNGFGRRLLVAVLSFLAVGWASAVTEITIVQNAPTTAREVQHGEATVYEPATTFNCREEIYFTMDAEPYRRETLAVSWIDPTGRTRDVIRMNVEHDAHGWVVRFKLRKGGSLTGFLDGPSAGYEDLIGTWTVTLASDKHLWSGRFEVLC